MEAMIKEAAQGGRRIDINVNPLNASNESKDLMLLTGRSLTSEKTFTKRSLALLTGDENDLLSASPVFNVDLPRGP